MKLIAKYNRLTIPVIILVFVLGGLAYYFILHNILIHQLDKDLKVEQMEIIRHISKTGTLPESSNYKDQVITFQPTESASFKERHFTQKIFNPSENEKTAFRSIEFLTTVGNAKYIATVLKSQQETEDSIQLILTITFSIIAVLLLTIFLSNRIILKKLWKPFYHTLTELKHFSLSSNSSIVLEKTGIEEFQELNLSVNEMTEKVKADYESLKNFTENASHEIQTPLAIIKNKIELLIQEEKLDESQMILLQSMNEAASRLSRMNQSLLLLAKIENRQFKMTENINFNSVLLRLVNNFEELAATKSIVVDIQML
jgi:signal transduction histidine kinase